MTRINAYLTFNGNCEEAMYFYRDCLGGELRLQTVEESPMAWQWPAETQKNVLYACLVKNDLVLLGSDIGSESLIKGNSVSLALMCRDTEEIERFFINLSEGGKITHPLHRFHDGTIGALTDKYGTNWLLQLPEPGFEG